jgi:hypothetical protein
VTNVKPLNLQNVNDDQARETAFYTHATAAVRQAIENLRQSEIPYHRPNDYFAEMLKPDTQMAKIKDSLIGEKRRMESVDKRKKEKLQRQFAKEVQIERTKSRARDKRNNINAVAKLRQSTCVRVSVRLCSVTVPVSACVSACLCICFFPAWCRCLIYFIPHVYMLTWPLALCCYFSSPVTDRSNTEDAINAAIGGIDYKGNRPAEKSRKRKAKDDKYGFGGEKRFKKKNSAQSTADAFAHTGSRRNRSRGGRKGGKPSRPGKDRRNAARSGK